MLTFCGNFFVNGFYGYRPVWIAKLTDTMGHSWVTGWIGLYGLEAVRVVKCQCEKHL